MCRCKESTRSSERKLLEILAAEFAKPVYSENIVLGVVGCGRSIVDTNLQQMMKGFIVLCQSYIRNLDLKSMIQVQHLKTYWKSILKLILFLNTSSPLNWWTKYQEKNRQLVQTTIMCLSEKVSYSSSTSTNCERLFSVAGQGMNEKRSNILPDNLDMICSSEKMNVNLDWWLSGGSILFCDSFVILSKF